MRVLIAHNYYQQPGGEDEVFSLEAALLQEQRHEVSQFSIRNDSIRVGNLFQVACQTVWNQSSYRKLRDVLNGEQFDVCHFHNTFPLLSPSVYYAAKNAGAAVVQTVHNYRLMCPAATFFRDGEVCEECRGRWFAWPAVVHRCYRQSGCGSAAVAALNAVQRTLKTWSHHVDAFISPTQFMRDKLIQAQFTGDRVHAKPHFVHRDPGVGAGMGGYALYMGRLSREKGICTLLEAWKKLRLDTPLKVAGDGPLSQTLRRLTSDHPTIEVLGRVSRHSALELMKGAELLVFPSEWFEGFGLVLVEAAATGTPVVASRIGGIPEIVEDGVTGLLFRPGDAEDLASKVTWLLDHPDRLREMRTQARATYERKYTAKANYEQLMNIYQAAILTARAKRDRHATERVQGMTRERA